MFTFTWKPCCACAAGGALKFPKRPQRWRQRRLSPVPLQSFPPSSVEGWRLQPAGGGPAWRPVGVLVHPRASGWSGYWWLTLKQRLRPCRLDGTLTRRLGRQESASHMSRSKVKHTIMGVSLNSENREPGRWPVVFSSWLDRPVWLALSWISESWMPTRLLVGTESQSTICCSHCIRSTCPKMSQTGVESFIFWFL